MTFHVGQKVVCVNSGRLVQRRGPHGQTFPTKGSVYTIKWVGEFPYAPDRYVGQAVRLVEIDRGPSCSGSEYDDYPYAACRFRLVIERKTDAGMAILKEILDRETVGDRTHVSKSEPVA